MPLTETGEHVIGSLTARGRHVIGSLTAEGRYVFGGVPPLPSVIIKACAFLTQDAKPRSRVAHAAKPIATLTKATC